MNDEGIGGGGLIDWVIEARELKLTYYIFRILFSLFVAQYMFINVLFNTFIASI